MHRRQALSKVNEQTSRKLRHFWCSNSPYADFFGCCGWVLRIATPPTSLQEKIPIDGLGKAKRKRSRFGAAPIHRKLMDRFIQLMALAFLGPCRRPDEVICLPTAPGQIRLGKNSTIGTRGNNYDRKIWLSPLAGHCEGRTITHEFIQ